MHAIGIDIGGTKIAMGVVDSAGRILAQLRRDTDPTDPGSIDRSIAEACNELAESYEVAAIGVAAAGFISADRRSVSFAPNLAWRDYPLADKISELLTKKVPIVIENDANAAGWAEFRFGAGRDAADMVMLTIGTGLGGAIIVGRELVRGRWGNAAELGHMRVVPKGHYCGCGHEGCWEQYASGSALVRDAKAVVVAQPHRAGRLLELAGGEVDDIKGPMVTQAAAEGDPLAIELVALLGQWIGEGAASVSAILDPELYVVGGGVCAAGDLLLKPALAAFETSLSGFGHRPAAIFRVAEHGNDAGIIGAADLARR